MASTAACSGSTQDRRLRTTSIRRCRRRPPAAGVPSPPPVRRCRPLSRRHRHMPPPPARAPSSWVAASARRGASSPVVLRQRPSHSGCRITEDYRRRRPRSTTPPLLTDLRPSTACTVVRQELYIHSTSERTYSTLLSFFSARRYA